MAHREKQIIFAYEIRTFCTLQDKPTATPDPLAAPLAAYHYNYLSLILWKNGEFWFRVCLGFFVLGRLEQKKKKYKGSGLGMREF